MTVEDDDVPEPDERLRTLSRAHAEAYFNQIEDLTGVLVPAQIREDRYRRLERRGTQEPNPVAYLGLGTEVHDSPPDEAEGTS